MTLPWLSRLLAQHQHLPAGSDLTQRLREQILAEGIPDEEQHDGGSSNRSIAWKVLLNVHTLDTADFLHFVSLGPSVVNEKIKNDT